MLGGSTFIIKQLDLFKTGNYIQRLLRPSREALLALNDTVYLQRSRGALIKRDYLITQSKSVIVYLH
jgi:hypothetical protein